MKKVLLLVFFVAIFLFVVIFRHNANLNTAISELTNEQLLRGGDLRYKIYFFGVLPVGEAVFYKSMPENYNSRSAVHLKAEAKTTGFISRFFKACAFFDTYLDARDSKLFLSRQEIRVQGKPDIKKEISYDQKNLIMNIAGVARSILPDTGDFLSVVFNFSRSEYIKGEKDFDLNINTNQKNYAFAGKLTEGEIEAGKDIYKVVEIKAKIFRRDKNPYHQSRVDITLLRTERENIPLLIKASAGGAVIVARLIEVK